MYTKYLTDRGQRLAFIETHKAMEHKKESEKEYQRTQKLLDSSRYMYLIFFFIINISNFFFKPYNWTSEKIYSQEMFD